MGPRQNCCRGEDEAREREHVLAEVVEAAESGRLGSVKTRSAIETSAHLREILNGPDSKCKRLLPLARVLLQHFNYPLEKTGGRSRLNINAVAVRHPMMNGAA